MGEGVETKDDKECDMGGREGQKPIFGVALCVDAQIEILFNPLVLTCIIAFFIGNSVA